MGWIGQDSGKGIDLQAKIMPKAWGKLLRRLNRHRCVLLMNIALEQMSVPARTARIMNLDSNQLLLKARQCL